MPRRARLSLPGIPWHIIQRGYNRSACFYTDGGLPVKVVSCQVKPEGL
jgi:REP element-mobilizing transposase RayT